MIKFFRKIRQKLLSENKFSKYLFYAIGEIILVVIGILIALGINNWNTDRIQKNNITNYYKRIIVELNEETENANYFKQNLDTLINKNKKALMIIDSKNLDSLIALKKHLGATATSWRISFKFPITREFIAQNYLSKIDNDSIKMGLEALNRFLEYTESTADFSRLQYLNTIEPFFVKNVNYSEIALPVYSKELIKGGPKTNYEDLLTNVELWNVITFKLETLYTESDQLNTTIQIFAWLKEQIIKDLDGKNIQ